MTIFIYNKNRIGQVIKKSTLYSFIKFCSKYILNNKLFTFYQHEPYYFVVFKNMKNIKIKD